MPLSPRAETRLAELEGLLESITECFYSESFDFEERLVTEDLDGDSVPVNEELTSLIEEANRLLYDEPVEIDLLNDYEV